MKCSIKMIDPLLERKLKIEFERKDFIITKTLFLLMSAFLKNKIFDHLTRNVTSRDSGVKWVKKFCFKMFSNKFEEKSLSIISIREKPFRSD